ncbi:ABC transporter substrate-binding protein [Streptomyces radicis]|nr:ABC transporter substrate-binding protein [Streptomyces radicis]
MVTKKTRGAVALVVAAALSSLAACGGDGDTVVEENADGTTSITVATVASDSGSQAFYADSLGFFEDQGLEVTVKVVANVPDLAAAVESGDAQFALTSPTSVASASTAGINFRIVAGGAIYTVDNPGVWIMVPAGQDGITSVDDLEGKSIAVNALNTMPHLSTLATLDDAGVDVDSINSVTLDFTQVGQAFESNQVDAATVTAPFNYQIESDGIGTTMLSPYDAVNNGEDFYNTIWFGEQGFIDSNPEVVDTFRAAIAETNAWANDPANEDERKAILQEVTSLTDATMEDMQLLLFDDEVSPEMIQPLMDLMERFEVLPQPVDAASIIAGTD